MPRSERQQRAADALRYLWKCFKLGLNPPRAPAYCWYTVEGPDGRRRECVRYHGHDGPCSPSYFDPK